MVKQRLESLVFHHAYPIGKRIMVTKVSENVTSLMVSVGEEIVVYQLIRHYFR